MDNNLPEGVYLGAEECTLDINGISENTYAISHELNTLVREYPDWIELRESIQYSNELLLYLERVYPNVVSHPFPKIDDWFMIGDTKPNEVNYFDYTIGVSFNNHPSSDLLNYLGIEDKIYFTEGFYSLKFQIDLMSTIPRVTKVVLKITCINDNSYLKVPKGIVKFPEEGRHLNDNRLNHFRDVYCLSTLSKSEVEDYFNVKVPYYGNEDIKYYGLLFDTNLDKVVKVKQYYYPKRSIRDVVSKIEYRSKEIDMLIS